MVNSIATDTNDLILITNLFNKCHMYTTYNEVDSQNLSNDEDFNSILKDLVKYNIDIICIYLNINNIHFKPSFKPKSFGDIYGDPFCTSGTTSVSCNINTVTCTVTQPHQSILHKILLRILKTYPRQFKNI